jgi:hypothetical protein
MAGNQTETTYKMRKVVLAVHQGCIVNCDSMASNKCIQRGMHEQKILKDI